MLSKTRQRPSGSTKADCRLPLSLVRQRRPKPPRMTSLQAELMSQRCDCGAQWVDETLSVNLRRLTMARHCRTAKLRSTCYCCIYHAHARTRILLLMQSRQLVSFFDFFSVSLLIVVAGVKVAQILCNWYNQKRLWQLIEVERIL